MSLVTKILVGLIAFEHLYFMYFEMFRWTSPRTIKLFGMTEEYAKASKSLAANQGLYNGFLCAGLVWSLIAPAPLSNQLAIFFAVCITIAGIYGGITATKRILLVQALPGAITLAMLLIAPI